MYAIKNVLRQLLQRENKDGQRKDKKKWRGRDKTTLLQKLGILNTKYTKINKIYKRVTKASMHEVPK